MYSSTRLFELVNLQAIVATMQNYLNRIALQANATQPCILHYSRAEGKLCHWFWYV